MEDRRWKMLVPSPRSLQRPRRPPLLHRKVFHLPSLHLPSPSPQSAALSRVRSPRSSPQTAASTSQPFRAAAPAAGSSNETSKPLSRPRRGPPAHPLRSSIFHLRSPL